MTTSLRTAFHDVRLWPGVDGGGARGPSDAHGQGADALVVTTHDANREARGYDDSDPLDEEDTEYCHNVEKQGSR